MDNDKDSHKLKPSQFDYLIFIGRFQPLHLGHIKVIESALKQADKVIVLIGSSFQAPSIRNPWSYEERKGFVFASFEEKLAVKIITKPLIDVYNDKKWVAQVNSTIDQVMKKENADAETARIGLIGHDKDHSSYYLKLFPNWPGVNVDSFNDISATPLRHHYFTYQSVPEGISPVVALQLSDFMETDLFMYLCSEFSYVEAYKKSWNGAPYSPVLVVVNAVVIHEGKLLLIRRKNHPGKGLCALPGGFLGQYERLQQGVIRELKEETRIDVSDERLVQCIKNNSVYDAPYRSSLGRVIAHAYLVVLDELGEEPITIEAADDAEVVFWQPVEALDPAIMFEDHLHIIKTMLAAGHHYMK